MPFLCYYLQVHYQKPSYYTFIFAPQVHDCIIAIMGSISAIEEELVFAFATKGWHMYFGLFMSALRWKKTLSLAREYSNLNFLFNYQRKS